MSFGSVLRGEACPGGDTAVPVELELGRTTGLLFVAIQDALSALLGRPVDLNIPSFRSRHFRDRVLRGALALDEGAGNLSVAARAAPGALACQATISMGNRLAYARAVPTGDVGRSSAVHDGHQGRLARRLELHGLRAAAAQVQPSAGVRQPVHNPVQARPPEPLRGDPEVDVNVGSRAGLDEEYTAKTISPEALAAGIAGAAAVTSSVEGLAWQLKLASAAIEQPRDGNV